MTQRHPIFSNTAYNLLHTVITFAIAYLMTPVILNRLGTEDYGIWVFLSIFSITGYFSLLDLGFQGAATKYVAEFLSSGNKQGLQEIVNTTLFFFFGIGLIGTIGLVVFNIFFLDVFQIPETQLSLVALLVHATAISFIFQFPALGYSAIIQGVQRYDYLRGVTIITTILSNLVLYFYLKNTNGLLFITIVTLLTSVVITILYALITKKLLPDIRLTIASVKRKTFGLMFSLSAKLFASKIVGLIFNNTDRIVIGIFLTVVSQTDYDIVNKLHIILLSILSIVNQSVLPASAEFAAKKDAATLQELLIRGTKYSAVLVLPALLLLMVFPSQLLTVWVGGSFAHLAPLVQLYVSHIFLTMLVGVSSTMFIGVDKVGRVLIISIVAAVINLVISLVTVHTLGIQGLILGTVLAYIISSIIYVIVANREFQIPQFTFIKKTILPLLPATIGIGIILFLTNTIGLPDTLIGWGVYVCALYGIFFVSLFYTGMDAKEKGIIHSYAQKIFKPARL